MVGTMASLLMKKPVYRDQMEKFLVGSVFCAFSIIQLLRQVELVFPEFQSPHGHLRARTCWVFHYFAEDQYKDQNVLAEALRLTVASLLRGLVSMPGSAAQHAV